MKIRSLMIPDPISIPPDASIREALEVMKNNAIRHLPVVGKGNRLVGFVTLADLKQGLIPSMLAEVSLTDLMVSDPITAHPDDDVELAASLIYTHKIGGIPIVEGDRLTVELHQTVVVVLPRWRTHRLAARNSWPLVVRQRPLSRFHCQPCRLQVNVEPSTTPNLDRSAFRCGHRR